ncbi:uncharacterized protein LOC127899849 [Citrus sinensis]|uniref:uncharacterized protein LOC127899849 n=1 Tax=Citrus sinensis TaxID=2711 RepID=UPI0022782210|nr:uncharacterized protein LOC127899849 [Citrus sinensis]
MKNEALKITREHGLTTPESVQLSVTNPRNKLSIIVDSEAVLQAQFALSAEQITWVNDGGNEPPPRTGGIQGPPIELNENDDDDVVYSTDGSRIDDTDDDDTDDDDQNEDNGADIMDDARGSSSDDETAKVYPQLLADTSDSDYDLGTTQLKDYIEVHACKPGRNGKHRLRLGDVFDDVEHFRYVLGEVMVDKGFEIAKVYNEPRRFYGKCKISECPWYVMGGKIKGNGGFAIKELQKKHECRQTGKSVAVNNKWIAEKIKRKVVVDPHVKISVLREFMLETYGVRIGDLKLYRGRERARKDINGDHARGYEDLFQYAAVIHKYDPGAICKVLCDVVTRPKKVLFQRFFMAFPTQKNALNNGCRPYIGLDGCHLKSKYGGVLLAAVGMDANNGMVPLALAVCEIENTETWSWFLEILHSYFDNGLEQITFCLDREKGLLGVIEITWPTAYHRPCARHVYANFCKEHLGVSLRNLFWRAVSSTNKFDYAIAMEKLKKEKLEAWQWLETELAGFTWSRHEYDKNCNVDRTTNNTSKCFNSWILPHREKPCLTMLEEIRCMFMTLFTERKKEAQSWTNVPPRVKKKLDAAYECGSKMNVMASGDLHFQVKDKGYYPARRFIVDLMSRSCDCGYWDLAGIPCTHAMAAISQARHTATEYLPKYFSKEAYLNTYVVMFKPIPDKVTWDPCDRPKLFPPEITKKIGRPKKSRKRAATEPIKKKHIILYLLLLLWWDEPQCQEMSIKAIDSKRIKSPAGQYEADNVSLNPTQGSQASQILDVV